MADLLRLPADPASPAAARAFVGDLVGRWGYVDLCGEILLMTSELVTNAVVHAREPITVLVEDLGGGIRVTVEDRDPSLPVRREPRPLDTGGRGWQIIEGTATSAGVVRRPPGKAVWFELVRPSGG